MHEIRGKFESLEAICSFFSKLFYREESPTTVHHADTAYDWMNPMTAYIYMKYALGSYGWMWYLYGGFWKGLSTLRSELMCCSCVRYKCRRAIVVSCF